MSDATVPTLHGRLIVRVLGARELSAGETSMVGMLSRVVTDASAAFCEVRIGPRSLMKTDTVNGGRNPTWDVMAALDVSDDAASITVKVYASALVKVGRVVKPRTLGKCDIDIAEIRRENTLHGREYSLSSKHRHTGAGYVTLGFEYIPLRDLMMRSWGDLSVPDSYFPLRKGCMVTLYQDAHAPENSLPPVYDYKHTAYKQRSAWKEIYNAILHAKVIIYVAGWSVDVELMMIRDETAVGRSPNARGISAKPLKSRPLTVGELLKKKADEGVTVSVVVWDEVASVNALEGIINTDGVMATQDEKTYSFFRNTKVHCEKFSRTDDGTNGLLGGLQTAGLWTHHIKHVICDREVPFSPCKRRLCCYMGGLDLTYGRYDTPRHDIFRTLGSTHRNDFHQGCVVGASVDIGPRQPWHDIHCCIEGPITWDVVRTFENRWRCQAPRTAGRALRSLTPDMFVSPEEESQILMKMPDHWNVQFFRSIDERSIIFDQAEHNQRQMSLSSKKGRKIDAGIEKAYIHHIRKAERMIYIENQYFMGSSHMWKSPSGISSNLIPSEIVRKICSKIKLHEEFAVYVVVPLMPEGTQVFAVSELLRWQARTVESMYARIGACIAQAGLAGVASPTDYLSFFCLGKRESMLGNQGTGTPIDTSPVFSLWYARRNMIYVHSKLMIVDDAVAIVGSANINSRSMAGTRDTEIAIATHQPAHTYELSSQSQMVLPRGDVHCFRMSLWAEHIGFLDNAFLAPWQPACMRKVREKGLGNWNLYIADSPRGNEDLPGHLMLFPYNVDAHGTVVSSAEHIPDFPKIPVRGKTSLMLVDTATG